MWHINIENQDKQAFQYIKVLITNRLCNKILIYYVIWIMITECNWLIDWFVHYAFLAKFQPFDRDFKELKIGELRKDFRWNKK